MEIGVRAALLGALVVAEPASIVAQAVVVITIECLCGVGAMGAPALSALG